MKILQFIYTVEPGGAERFVVDLSNELAMSHDTTIYTIRDDGIQENGFYVSEISKNVNYINLKVAKGFNPRLILMFLKIVKKEKPHVVHCHLNLVNYFLPISVIYFKRIKFFYTIHSSAHREVKSGPERLLRRFCFKHRFFIPISISDETKQSYESYYRLKNSPVIYNGRSAVKKTDLFEKVLEEVECLKSAKKTRVFIHVSRYHEAKNQRMLFSVFTRLYNEDCDFILLVIGKDFENEFDIKTLAEKNIFFLGTKSNVPDYLYASDAFCLSSLNEGMPISLIEALACGCIPICTPVGGCADVIKNGLSGYLSKSIQEDDYYNAVREFIDKGESINKERLVDIYNEKFSISQCAQKYLELYAK